MLRQYAVLANCQYVIAVPQEFRLTLAASLEPGLRKLLNIRVVLVGSSIVEL